jgi:hypothetical protein
VRFLKLPGGAVQFIAIATICMFVWLFWGTFKHPATLWAPGDLSRFHADIKSCDSCHQPFQGTTVDKCIVCHSEKRFALRSSLTVAAFHQTLMREQRLCSECHTEHRGALAQITVGEMLNPHGEMVFRATGTSSCSACHDFSAGTLSRGQLLNNAVVRHLMEEGDGAHRPGKMANCLACHRGGRMEVEGEEREDDDD